MGLFTNNGTNYLFVRSSSFGLIEKHNIDDLNVRLLSELKEIAEELGENFTDSEFEEMMKLSSWNEKEISRDDFYRLFSDVKLSHLYG